MSCGLTTAIECRPDRFTGQRHPAPRRQSLSNLSEDKRQASSRTNGIWRQTNHTLPKTTGANQAPKQHAFRPAKGRLNQELIGGRCSRPALVDNACILSGSLDRSAQKLGRYGRVGHLPVVPFCNEFSRPTVVRNGLNSAR